jgi:hypothetical protein
MDPNPPFHQPGAEYQLQRDLYLQLVDGLRGYLPPPSTDTPEAWLRRDRLAIAKVAALLPASPPEADLAALHVAAMAHAADCLRLAVLAAADPKRWAQAHAQSARMGREGRGYLGALLRLQAVRGKREADDATREGAAWTEQSTGGLMTDALERLEAEPRPPRPAPAPVPEKPVPEKPVPEKPQWRDYAEWSDEEKRQEKLLSDVGLYAVLHTERVKRIRQLGGLPADCDYEPPPPEMLDIIIHGDHANLRWADTYVPYKARDPAD